MDKRYKRGNVEYRSIVPLIFPKISFFTISKTQHTEWEKRGDLTEISFYGFKYLSSTPLPTTPRDEDHTYYQ